MTSIIIMLCFILIVIGLGLAMIIGKLNDIIDELKKRNSQ